MNRVLRATIAAVALLVSFSAFAQYYDPYQAQMAQMDAYLDAWVAEQYQQIAAQQAQSMAQFVAIYRETTGDYQTPDDIAAAYGMEIFCRQRGDYCAQVHASWSSMGAAHHAENMNNIAGWGAVSNQVAATNQDILDGMYDSYQNRDAMNSAGHDAMIQGAVQGQGTFVNPNSGAAWDLPLYPDPNWSYTAPSGEPLAFDYNTGVWYVGTVYGWMPLQQNR